ncbi:MAG: aldo/keto reductase [Acidobacteria bacterium]|nr:aldo/keto reductase [Acidobacteriota bacterium]
MPNEDRSWNPLDHLRMGYGAMVLEGYYGASDARQAKQLLQNVIQMGLMIDTADAYGNGNNEKLVGGAAKDRRYDSFIATKFGIVFDPQIPASEWPTGWGFSLRLNGRPSYVEQALNASLQRLGRDFIDLWYLHYPDPNVPIEETVGAMAQAVEQGKVRYLGLSNVTPEQVARAHAVHPIHAVQYEYSMWRREAEAELLPLLRSLGIILVAWGPLGSGFLSGQVQTLDGSDFRRFNPRFSAENLARNRERFAPIFQIAQELDITPAQLALAWILHQYGPIVPIPGTRSINRLKENAAAVQVHLDGSVLAQLEHLAKPGLASGQTLL